MPYNHKFTEQALACIIGILLLNIGQAFSSNCQLPKDEGTCEDNLTKFFFNKESGTCEEFTYGGCQGNDNRFDSLEECNEACAEDSSKKWGLSSLGGRHSSYGKGVIKGYGKKVYGGYSGYGGKVYSSSYGSYGKKVHGGYGGVSGYGHQYSHGYHHGGVSSYGGSHHGGYYGGYHSGYPSHSYGGYSRGYSGNYGYPYGGDYGFGYPSGHYYGHDGVGSPYSHYGGYGVGSPYESHHHGYEFTHQYGQYGGYHHHPYDYYGGYPYSHPYIEYHGYQYTYPLEPYYNNDYYYDHPYSPYYNDYYYDHPYSQYTGYQYRHLIGHHGGYQYGGYPYGGYSDIHNGYPYGGHGGYQYQHPYSYYGSYGYNHHPYEHYGGYQYSHGPYGYYGVYQYNHQPYAYYGVYQYSHHPYEYYGGHYNSYPYGTYYGGYPYGGQQHAGTGYGSPYESHSAYSYVSPYGKFTKKQYSSHHGQYTHGKHYRTPFGQYSQKQYSTHFGSYGKRPFGNSYGGHGLGGGRGFGGGLFGGFGSFGGLHKSNENSQGQNPKESAESKYSVGRGHGRPYFCYSPVNYGSCFKRYTRYFYNPSTHQCERFTYRGCNSNKNNFQTFYACKQACKPHYYGPGESSKNNQVNSRYYGKSSDRNDYRLTAQPESSNYKFPEILNIFNNGHQNDFNVGENVNTYDIGDGRYNLDDASKADLYKKIFFGQPRSDNDNNLSQKESENADSANDNSTYRKKDTDGEVKEDLPQEEGPTSKIEDTGSDDEEPDAEKEEEVEEVERD